MDYEFKKTATALTDRVRHFLSFEASLGSHVVGYEEGKQEVRKLARDLDKLVEQLPPPPLLSKGAALEQVVEYLEARGKAIGVERNALREVMEDYEGVLEATGRGVEALDEAIEALSELT